MYKSTAFSRRTQKKRANILLGLHAFPSLGATKCLQEIEIIIFRSREVLQGFSNCTSLLFDLEIGNFRVNCPNSLKLCLLGGSFDYSLWLF